MRKQCFRFAGALKGRGAISTRRKGNHARIKVTRSEVDFLHKERVRAMHECPDLAYQRGRRDKAAFWDWQDKLEILGRDKDGSLLARVVLGRRGSKTRYVRNLRVHPSIGSTEDRALELRGVTG